ncbi:unnamed protein product [Caenorhabditis brenneri]
MCRPPDPEDISGDNHEEEMVAEQEFRAALQQLIRIRTQILLSEIQQMNLLEEIAILEQQDQDLLRELEAARVAYAAQADVHQDELQQNGLVQDAPNVMEDTNNNTVEEEISNDEAGSSTSRKRAREASPDSSSAKQARVASDDKEPDDCDKDDATSDEKQHE